MEMGRLEAFIQVATKLSFSRAAEGLYLTQPTVTARIQGLERELGEPLFERMGAPFASPTPVRRSCPTPSGPCNPWPRGATRSAACATWTAAA